MDANGVYTTIDDPLATDGTSVWNINNVGQIVGSYSDATGSHGFVDTNGSFVTLDVPPSSGTGASGINDKGQVVGYYTTVNGQNSFEANVPEPTSVALLGAGMVSLHLMRRRRRQSHH